MTDDILPPERRVYIKSDICALCKRPWSEAGEVAGHVVHPVRRDLNPLCWDCVRHIRDVSDRIEHQGDADYRQLRPKGGAQ